VIAAGPWPTPHQFSAKADESDVLVELIDRDEVVQYANLGTELFSDFTDQRLAPGLTWFNFAPGKFPEAGRRLPSIATASEDQPVVHNDSSDDLGQIRRLRHALMVPQWGRVGAAPVRHPFGMADDKLTDLSRWLPAKRRKDRKSLELSEVKAFGEQPAHTQFQVLQDLRSRVATDFAPMSIAISAVALALAALFFPAASTTWSTNGLSNLISGVIIGVVVVIALAPTLIGIAMDQAARVLAMVWLAAYEDELERRRSMPGLVGRRWRRSH
jgi:hypothetical protein